VEAREVKNVWNKIFKDRWHLEEGDLVRILHSDYFAIKRGAISEIMKVLKKRNGIAYGYFVKVKGSQRGYTLNLPNLNPLVNSFEMEYYETSN